MVFHRISSPYDELEESKQEAVIRQSFHYNKNAVHLIEQPIEQQVAIRVDRVDFAVDIADFHGPLANFLTNVESQVKNIINVVDTVNVVLASQIEQPETFFIGKREKVSAPLSVNLLIGDTKL